MKDVFNVVVVAVIVVVVVVTNVLDQTIIKIRFIYLYAVINVGKWRYDNQKKISYKSFDQL